MTHEPKITLAEAGASRSTLCALCGAHEHTYDAEQDQFIDEIKLFLMTDTRSGNTARVDLCGMCVDTGQDDELEQFVISDYSGRA